MFQLLLNIALLSLVSTALVDNRCHLLGYCNGHGVCNNDAGCDCYEGYFSADCSLRTCPFGRSWGDVPTSSTRAHQLAECSDQGYCERNTGRCICFDGFTGNACQRSKCPNNCSGHGKCMSMSRIAEQDDYSPVGSNFVYGRNESDKAWDSHKLYGCVCDSSWPVGLRFKDIQRTEWFGPDCSLRHCPTGDDKSTEINELDCYAQPSPGGVVNGSYGNLCFVECSNRGVCDYSTGTCRCFPGRYGVDCSRYLGYVEVDDEEIIEDDTTIYINNLGLRNISELENYLLGLKTARPSRRPTTISPSVTPTEAPTEPPTV